MNLERRQEENAVEPFQRETSLVQSSGERDPEVLAIRRVALSAFAVSLLLAGLKGSLAWVSGSLALMADALESATDSLASLMVWVGLQLSMRKARSFPYGLYKIENLMSVAVAVLILLAGVKIAREALRTPAELPHVTWPVLGGVLAGVIVCSLLAWYATVVGLRTHSPTLIAEGKHRLVDVLSSTVVLGALISNLFGFRADRIAAVMVVVLILWASFELLRDGVRVLLDASLDAETMRTIRSTLDSHPGVAGVMFLTGRNAGRFRFVETALTLKTDNLRKAHRISGEIEDAIRREVPHVERVLIHAEPSQPESILVAMPLADVSGTLSSHFGEAPFYAFERVRVDSGKSENREVLVNPFASVPKGKGVRVAEWLIERRIDLVLVREPLKGKGPGYALESAGVEVRVMDAARISEALETTFREGWQQGVTT
jgi:cation diffusion facilitator family transporter